MPSLESSIDELYKAPLGEFVSARTALARTLKGADAARVKALKKPTVVPWAVNQLYWHARPVYDRLAKSGAALRSAQVAALGGRQANVRAATEAHRQAVTAAVAEASSLAARSGMHPGVEELARMLEAVSLARELPDPPGRLIGVIAPPGFEALAGIAIKPGPDIRPPSPAATPLGKAPAAAPHTAPVTSARVNARMLREQAAAERRQRAALEHAETVLRRATEAEAHAKQAWERAQEERQSAARALDALRAEQKGLSPPGD